MIDLNKELKYLLACSFGPDSMALFDMLIKEKILFSVAHVNYNLRQESKEETERLKRYCKERNIEIFVYENLNIIDKNIEEKCREIRYRFFQEIYQKNGFDALLVAHNEDDNIETYLLQKNRKNLVLFYGMSCKSSLFSMNVIRPLLHYKKSELLKYCLDNHVPYAIDTSNKEDKFLRNRIRHNIVELMTNDDRRKILCEINKANDALEKVLNEAEFFNSNKIADLQNVDPKVFPYVVNRLARKVKKDAEISSRLCNEIKKSLISSKPNVTVLINKNFAFIKEYEDFKFDFLEPISYKFYAKLGDVIENDFIYFDTNFDLEKRNIQKEDFPIEVRNAEDKDRIKINNYYVQVRRLFIDWKMPKSIRSRWPVIVNKDNVIVYIPRYRKDFDKTKSPNFYVKL